MVQMRNAPLQRQVECDADQLNGSSTSVSATKANANDMTRIMEALG